MSQIMSDSEKRGKALITKEKLKTHKGVITYRT